MQPGTATKEILENALRKGGEVLLSYFGKSIKTRLKESISSVITEADLAAEKVIIGILEATDEPFNIISEESGYLDHGSPCTWVVDPLDGTSNFAAGLPWFGIIIALFEQGTPLMGGMYLPVDRTLYTAETGKGAWKNGTQVRTTSSVKLPEQLVAYSFDFNDTAGKTESEMKLLARLSRTVRNIRSTNCLLDFCYVADGRFGAALNQTTRIWDIAVPWLLIREAGGKVSDIAGRDIQFNLSPRAINHNYTIVAAGAGLHDSLMDIVAHEKKSDKRN